MMRNGINLWLRLTACLASLMLIAISGCGSDELNSPTALKLQGIANMYLDYTVSKNGKGPAREQDLKNHIRAQPDFNLHRYGIDLKDIDATFVSQRDKEAFVVLYGMTIGGISGKSGPLLAHEKNGKNGKRLIVYINTKVDLVDEAKLQELLAAKQ